MFDFELGAVSVIVKDDVSHWLVKFVQLPVEEDDVEAFLPPPPLQLSLVLVVTDVFPAVVVIIAPPIKCEAEGLQEYEVIEEVCCICCNCSFVLSRSVV